MGIHAHIPKGDLSLLGFTNHLQTQLGFSALFLSFGRDARLPTAFGIINPFLGKGKDVIGILLPVKFSSTPSEVIDLRDVEQLKIILSSLI